MKVPVNHKIHSFIMENPNLETPFLVVDIDTVTQRFQRLKNALPFATCHYSVKANASGRIIHQLHQQGAHFEAASIYEIKRCLDQGVPARHIHYGNTIKKYSNIAEAYQYGIRSYTFDSAMELDKLADAAPGSRVFCRMEVDSEGAVWGLTKKFGRKKEHVLALLTSAHAKGLSVAGISFHVGSQQTKPETWEKAIQQTADIYHQLNAQGIYPDTINLGGGFPASYKFTGPDIETYGRTIQAALNRHFPQGIASMIEPGRSLVADAGVIKSEIILITHRKDQDHSVENAPNWIYLDIGKFNGLFESGDVLFPIITDRDDDTTTDVVLAGPTCDSADILYEQGHYRLPVSLQHGDAVFFLNVGAYSTSYATQSFNGFPPLAEHYI